MLDSIHISHVFVADQDQALDFYVGKLGLEVSNDQDLGFMRWLTVRVPGSPDATSYWKSRVHRRWTRHLESRFGS